MSNNRKGYHAETRYVEDLPSWRQKEVAKELGRKAQSLGLAQDDIDRALNSRLCDLADLLGKRMVKAC